VCEHVQAPQHAVGRPCGRADAQLHPRDSCGCARARLRLRRAVGCDGEQELRGAGQQPGGHALHGAHDRNDSGVDAVSEWRLLHWVAGEGEGLLAQRVHGRCASSQQLGGVQRCSPRCLQPDNLATHVLEESGAGGEGM
jgi:hypothetical protein